MTLSASDHDRKRTPPSIHSVMNLGCQPTPGAPNTVTCRFTQFQRQILVIRSCPLCPDRGAWCSWRADEPEQSWRQRKRSSRRLPEPINHVVLLGPITTEGLTIAEAGNDLAFLVTGVYGKPAPRQMGAPPA